MRKYVKLVSLAVIIPFLFISFIAFLTWLSAQLNIFKVGLVIDFSGSLKLREYISFYLATMGILVTGYFSYALLEYSRKSYKLSEVIKDREDNRENELLSQSASYLYTDLKMFIDRTLILLEEEMKLCLTLSGDEFEQRYEKRKNYIVFKTIGNVNNVWKEHLSRITMFLRDKDIKLDTVQDLYRDFELAEMYLSEEKIRAAITSLPKDILLSKEYKSLWRKIDNNSNHYSDLVRLALDI